MRNDIFLIPKCVPRLSISLSLSVSPPLSLALRLDVCFSLHSLLLVLASLTLSAPSLPSHHRFPLFFHPHFLLETDHFCDAPLIPPFLLHSFFSSLYLSILPRFHSNSLSFSVILCLSLYVSVSFYLCLYLFLSLSLPVSVSL